MEDTAYERDILVVRSRGRIRGARGSTKTQAAHLRDAKVAALE